MNDNQSYSQSHCSIECADAALDPAAPVKKHHRFLKAIAGIAAAGLLFAGGVVAGPRVVDLIMTRNTPLSITSVDQADPSMLDTTDPDVDPAAQGEHANPTHFDPAQSGQDGE